MESTITTTTVERVDPVFSPSEQLALAGFLAGYSGLTRDAYALDLRQFVVWCTAHSLALFAVRRADIECFGRELEAKGKARATVARRLSTIVGFYRYAEEEALIALSPGALDRNEVGAMLVVAGLGHPPRGRTHLAPRP
jgi:integrase/recombinase XerD